MDVCHYMVLPTYYITHKIIENNRKMHKEIRSILRVNGQKAVWTTIIRSKKPLKGQNFCERCETNQAVQPLNMAKGLKFRIQEE